MFRDGYNGGVDALEMDLDVYDGGFGKDDEVLIDRRFYYDRGERVLGEWMKGDFRECEVMGFWGRNENPMKRQVEVKFLCDGYVTRKLPNQLRKIV